MGDSAFEVRSTVWMPNPTTYLDMQIYSLESTGAVRIIFCDICFQASIYFQQQPKSFILGEVRPQIWNSTIIKYFRREAVKELLQNFFLVSRRTTSREDSCNNDVVCNIVDYYEYYIIPYSSIIIVSKLSLLIE